MIQLLGFAASLTILTGYWLSTKQNNINTFHKANLIGGPPLLLSEALIGAWFAVLLTTFFMILAAQGLKNSPKPANTFENHKTPIREDGCNFEKYPNLRSSKP